ncbi:hydroxyethylthiazole kinase [Gracilibacillus sp. JCM 18860]|uniref:hydroxyethylthiazole kinase n=1 Tax=Gracilibacillus sp. JCM 18860 TaxID=1306159 RepID=UPI0006D01D87
MKLTQIQLLREKQPLIHNITNQVVMNFTANGLYAIGASPVMAHAKEEVEEMAQIADAVVLNIGTLTQDQVDAMILAGKSANKAGVPVVLDPVGVGATTFRTSSALRILDEVDVTIIRGNAGEVANLAGMEVKVKGGVDVTGDLQNENLATLAAKKFNTNIAITGGEVDVVTNGLSRYRITNGHPLLTKVTGTGCLLSAVIGGAFLAVEKDVLTAATTAISYYGVAAEEAAQQSNLPGSFQITFLDQLNHLNMEAFERKSRISMGTLGSEHF